MLLVNLQIEKSLARTSELLTKVLPKGKSNSPCTAYWVLKLFWGRGEGQGGNAWVNPSFWSNSYGYKSMKGSIKAEDAAFPT